MSILSFGAYQWLIFHILQKKKKERKKERKKETEGIKKVRMPPLSKTCVDLNFKH
jgi:hypothetical protein